MMEEIFTIPLENVPQSFNIELAGRALSCESKWNDQSEVWELSISDALTEEPLAMSIPLVAGADLLAQHGHLGIPGRLICYTDGNQYAPPTLNNLGQESNLYYFVEL